MNQSIWETIASCWIVIRSKEELEQTEQFIAALFQNSMNSRNEEIPIEQEVFGITYEEDDEDIGY